MHTSDKCQLHALIVKIAYMWTESWFLTMVQMLIHVFQQKSTLKMFVLQAHNILIYLQYMYV